MNELLSNIIQSRKVLILGFGKEGQSTYRYFRQNFPAVVLAIADQDEDLMSKIDDIPGLRETRMALGKEYMECLKDYSLIIKSPGVVLQDGIELSEGTIVTSQTSLMLQAFRDQIIGITGTKGKSTTSSLVYHLLQAAGQKSILVGNIGRPPFDYLHQVDRETQIVFEMSSHQLQDASIAPHIAILLNLYPEHLDHYPSLGDYYGAKMKILSGQHDGDIFIYNEDIPEINRRITQTGGNSRYYSFSAGVHVQNGCFLAGDHIFICREGISEEYIEVTDEFPLKGSHNRMNMMAAILAARSAGANDEFIKQGLRTFKGLEHRLEYVGRFRDIHFYNDSIATIPEAAMAAVRSLPDTDTIILGGYDRMLDYSTLVDFLNQSGVRNFIFTGKAGERMMERFKRIKRSEKNLFWADTLADACKIAFIETEKGKICLLSPAAASYDSFRNFEERGKLFKKIARGDEPLA
jgi:UDP-N-acetylmuramoylalanine--D-glutamate ligase